MAKEYLGVIVDNKDPLKLGRVKVKILEHSDEIGNDENIWVEPDKNLVFGKNGAGSFSYPKIGTVVSIRKGADKYHLNYSNIEVYSSELKSLLKENYENTHVLLIDADVDVRILYTKKDGIMIFCKGSYINISSDGKTIVEKSDEHYIDSSNVYVGNQASHPAVLCDKLIPLLMKMAVAIDSKVGPPSAITAEVTNAFQSICSKIVKIAD